jgi:hypothetical protein
MAELLSLTKCYSCSIGRMTAELSQPTLGLLRRILEGMEPAYAVALPDRKKFWKDQLFDFGFPPRVIEIAVSYEFQWGDIISDLFIGKFGPQNQHFADALPPYFCEQTLRRLLALALHEGTDSVLIEQLAESLKREGVEVTWTDKPIAQTTEAQTSSTTWLSDAQREVLKTVVSQFLETNEPTSRILLVKKVVDPDIIDELTPVLLRNPTVEKLFPTAVAFHYCEDKNALEAAKSAVQLVIRTLRKLFASAGEKVHFSIDEIEGQARLILNTQRGELGSSHDRVAVQLGLYLIQDFRRVHAGIGGVYPNIAHVVVNERIGSINPATAWNEHIEQYSSYLKNRGEKTAVSNESMESAENPAANAEPVASEGNKPMVMKNVSVKKPHSDAENPETSKPPSKRNKLVALVILIAGFIGGLAAFKDNLLKLLPGIDPPQIVFKAENVTLDPTTNTRVPAGTISLHQLVTFRHTLALEPTDPKNRVQQITFRYPSNLKFEQDPVTVSEVAFDNLLMKVQPFLLGAVPQEHQGNLDGVRCDMPVPVVIETDFIDEHSSRYLNKSMYFLDTQFDHQIGPFAYITSLRFDHSIGMFEHEEKTLDRAYAVAKASCHPVPVIPEALRHH